MKKILVITQDEINNEKNENLFSESLNFSKSIASNSNLSYTQLACFEYENGLLYNLLTTYMDNSNRNANIIFDSPNNISTFNKLFPKNNDLNIYRDIFTAKNGISVSNIRKMPSPANYQSRINTAYHFNNTSEFIFNNFNYVILHHGGINLLYYFTTLNKLLFSSADDYTNFKKLILVNKDNLFTSLLDQYKTFEKLGLDKNSIHKNVKVVNNLSNCLDLIEEDIIYTPSYPNKGFTID